MKKILSLLTLLLLVCSGAWAEDYQLKASTCTSSTTWTFETKNITLSPSHGGAGQTGYADYIKFSKSKTYTLNLPETFTLTNINVKGYTNSNGTTDGELTSVAGTAQTGKTFPAKDDANLSTNACITDGYDFAVSQKGGSIAFVVANTNQLCVLITLTGSFEAATAPEIITQPVSGVFQKDATGKTLTVSATPSTGECLYQWYNCDDAERTNESSLGESAQTATYTVPTGTEGTYYYFCRVSDGGSNTTDTDIATVRILDRAPKQTWDVTEINYEDVKYNTTFWTETSANRTYRHDFEKNTYGTLQDNYGNDLLNGIQVIRPDGTLPLYLYCGSPYFGINAQGAKNKPAKFIVPVEEGKYYEVAYTSKDKGKEVGYLVAGATIVSGDNTRAFGADESWTKITFLVQATSTSMTLTNTAGETDGDANSCTLISIKEVATLSGAWTPASSNVYQNDPAPAPTFAVSASDASDPSGEYSVAYSEVSDDNGIVTVDAETGITAIDMSKAGTATVRATITSGTYIVATATVDYTITINAKVPTYTLNKADNEISLRSTPVHRSAEPAVSETATVTMSANFLEGTDGTVVFVEPVAGLSVSPIKFNITDGSVAEKTFTITYNSASGASGTATLRFSDGNGNTKDLLVDYASVVAHTLQDVTETTTWDWSGMPSTCNVQLKDDGTTTPAKGHLFDVVAADYDGEVYSLNANWPNTFPADKIVFYRSEWPVRWVKNNGTYHQGVTVKMHTTVPGTIQVWYSNTGTKDVARFLEINGKEYGDSEGNGSKSSTIISTAAIAVPAGDITITGKEGDAVNYVHIQKIVFTATDAGQESIEIACEGGLASYTTTDALDFTTSNAEAFIVTSTGSSTASLTKVTKVPAGKGIIVKGTKGQTVNVLTTEAATDDVSENLLEPVTAAKTVAAGEAYALSKTDGKFHPVSAGVTIPAGKAYLPASLFATGARDITLVFEDEEGGVTTSITGIEAKAFMESNKFYNLNGQRVENPTKGLYIVNGRKVVIK